MQTKAEAVTLLNEEFQAWEALIAQKVSVDPLASLSPEQIVIKETLIHLWAWQQFSIAYLEAAAQGKDPVYPPWPFEITIGDEGDVDATNAWIAQTYSGKSWGTAYQDWKTGFITFIALAEQLPETDLLDGGKYPWREGWPLLASLEGSYEHHQEHREAFANPPASE